MHTACAKLLVDGRTKQRQDRGCGCGIRWCRCWWRWWGNCRRFGTRRSRRCNGIVSKYGNWGGSRCWRGDRIRRLPALQETEVNVGLQLHRRSREWSRAALLVFFAAGRASLSARRRAGSEARSSGPAAARRQTPVRANGARAALLVLVAAGGKFGALFICRSRAVRFGFEDRMPR